MNIYFKQEYSLNSLHLKEPVFCISFLLSYLYTHHRKLAISFTFTFYLSI